MSCRLLWPFAVLALAAGTLPVQASQEKYFDALGTCYDAVLDARFEQAEDAIEQGCGRAPREACDLVRASAVWWRIQLDPLDRSRDADFQAKINSVIDATEAWVEREPRLAEAHFFRGAAYGARVQWRVLRGERLSAARDGKRIKESLERALSLDPTLQDAHFGIGMYRYYADLAPTVLKFVRWLLFLPGGDRGRGLKEMVQAREHGELLRGETTYQLLLIYLWYEDRVDEALELLDELRARYPHNPLFVQAAAEVHDAYRHDPAASLETWSALLNLARQGRVALPAMSERRARVGMAESMDALFETDRAIEQLRAVTAAPPAGPYGLAARAYLRLGEANDRLGLRDEAVKAYEAALAAAPPGDPDKVKSRANARLRRRPDPRAAEAYRLSLEGWRQLQRGELQAASESLARSEQVDPDDLVLRYRIGRLRAAQGDAEFALEEFERVNSALPTAPPSILAASNLEAARILEKRGDRVRAIELYKRAAGLRGAAADTRSAAAQSLARMGVQKQ